MKKCLVILVLLANLVNLANAEDNVAALRPVLMASRLSIRWATIV